MWPAIAVTAVGLYLEKLAGYLLPARMLEGETSRRVATMLPIALLSAIVVVQGLTGSGAVQLDARVPGLLVAIVLLVRRANFLVMVLAATATTALVRQLGWMA